MPNRGSIHRLKASNALNYTDYAFFMILFIFIYAIRWFLFFPAGIVDDIQFCLAGRSISKGFKLYTDIGDVKGPLLYYTFAAIDTISNGITPVKLRLLSLTFLFGSSLFLFKIAKNFISSRLVLYTLVIVWSLLDFPLSYSDIYAAFFICGAFYFFLNYQKNKLNLYLIPAGLFLGIALLYNQRTFIYILALITSLLLDEKVSINLFKKYAILSISFLLPIIIVITPFLLNGTLADLLFWVVFKAGSYGAAKGALFRFVLLPFSKIRVLLVAQLGILILPFILVTRETIKSKIKNREQILFICWFAAGLVPWYLDGKATARYNLFMLPAILIPSFVYVEHLLKKKFKSKKLYTLIAVILIMLPATYSMIDRSRSRSRKILSASQTEDRHTSMIKQYIETYAPAKRVLFFPWYRASGWNFIIDLTPTTRFLWSGFHLSDPFAATSKNFMTVRSWDIFRDELITNKPEVIVDFSSDFVTNQVKKIRNKALKLEKWDDEGRKGTLIELIRQTVNYSYYSGCLESTAQLQQQAAQFKRLVDTHYIRENIDGTTVYRLRTE